jgi:hypothetical protein
MVTPERIYRGSVRVLSVAFLGIGLAILTITLASGGGALSVGTLLGVAFVVVGAGRLWISARTSE